MQPMIANIIIAHLALMQYTRICTNMAGTDKKILRQLLKSDEQEMPFTCQPK